jgi:hypothetical protein
MIVKNRLRRDNFIKVLESLWLRPNRSRADIARELRLDRSTVGYMVDQMVELGIIEQTSNDSTGPRGGRPSVLLRILPGYAYSIGVELTFPNMNLIAVDLCGRYMGERTIPIQDYGPRLIDSLAVETSRFQRSVGAAYEGRQGLLTLGVGASGVVDEERKHILLSDALGIECPLPVAEPLEKVLAVPITVINDAQASVLREAGRRKQKDILLVQVRYHPRNAVQEIGIGAGLVIGNQLIRGRTITHLLKPPVLDDEEKLAHYIDTLGQSFALAANISGVDEIVLGGDATSVLDRLDRSILHHMSRKGADRDSPVIVSRLDAGSDNIAAGAAYAAVGFLFSSLTFPLAASFFDAQ